jgi:VWA domain-containing protein
MRLRHKQPTLVSMWMLDVFCCALGCVILLLLLKMREASFAAAEASSTSSVLADTRLQLSDSEDRNRKLLADGALLQKELDKTARALALIEKEQDETAKALALVQKERDAQAKDLAVVRNQKDELAKKLAAAEKTIQTTEAELALVRKKLDADAKSLALVKERSARDELELAKKNADLVELAKKTAASEKERDALAALLREKEKARTDALRQSLDMAERLLALENKLKNSEKQVDDLSAKSADAAKMRAKLADLERQLADASVTIVDLQGTKAKLADKINQLQIESENRFAGIAMTGKNVVFLVDISGSMVRTDENTIDNTKWPAVCDTLVKVMRTIPDLEQFQIILFSNKVSYLLGNANKWLTIDRSKPGEKERILKQIHQAMSEVKPNGDTNLHMGLTEAFKFRTPTLKLDTIYFISDGLPTSGPGLTAADESRNLSETERCTILARYLRTMLRTDWNRSDPQRPRVRINSIGFFYESPDVGAFLWALSRENDGSFVGMSRP